VLVPTEPIVIPPSKRRPTRQFTSGVDSGGSSSTTRYGTSNGVLSANLQTANHDGPKKDKRKRKADSEPETFAMKIDDDDNGDSALSDNPKYFLLS
jgi:hypothetical protein